MKEIIQPILEAAQAEGSIESRYPQYNPDDGKVHVLYVHCLINGQGWYRMILPSLALNATDTHAAIIGTAHKWDFTKRFNDYDNPIDIKLIQWADIVVLPAMMIDFGGMMRKLKTINPNLAFVMDIDTLYHELPPEHPVGKRLTEEGLNHLVKNMARMDLVTAPTHGLTQYYSQLLEESYKIANTEFEEVPNLLPSDGLVLSSPTGQSNGKLKLGIVGSSPNAADVQTIKGALEKVFQRHPEKYELVLFGWNGKYNGQEVLQGIPYKVVKPVNIMDYYQRLSELQLDVALLPLARVAYNVYGKSDIRFGELAAFGIPAIAQNLPPYKSIISDEENGILVMTEDQWIEAIESIPEHRSKYKELGEYAQRTVLKQQTWTRLKSQALADLYT